VGPVRRKRFLPYQARAQEQAAQAAVGAVVRAAPGAAVPATATRRNESAWLILVATAGLLAGIGAAWLIGNAGPARASFSNVPFAMPVAVLVGWSFIGSGLLAWRSRPDSHLTAVMIFTGFAWFREHAAQCAQPGPVHGRGSGPALLLRGLRLPGPFVPVRPVAGCAGSWLVAAAIALVTIDQAAGPAPGCGPHRRTGQPPGGHHGGPAPQHQPARPAGRHGPNPATMTRYGRVTRTGPIQQAPREADDDYDAVLRRNGRPGTPSSRLRRKDPVPPGSA
jgi:hypothetical protein